ncbi:MAG: (4Fe-4S)-binding protein [Leptospirales bacterium]|nr:(4Fe-4S)-binding protein [Leptospirales bacterium]
MKEITKKYSNGEIEIIWKPGTCIHSGICFRGLPAVFDPRAKPWITPAGANTEAIRAQIEACPSKALTFKMLSDD